MSKRPTIIDVARAAGVSKSTVSLVLQNSSSVKAETRKQVEAAIKETRYIYNRAAAKMRGAGTGLIGLIINDLRNPYYTELAATVQMAFSKAGYATVIANSSEDPDLQDQVVASMIEHGVSGLMIAPCYGGGSQIFDDILRAGIPTLQVLRQGDARSDLFPFFSMDYEHGGFLATDHLLAQGAGNIAFVGGVTDRPITTERKAGYIARLQQAGHEISLFHGAADRAFGYATALEIARNHPTLQGAVTFNDLVALGMLAGFAELGVSVGEEFRLVGFDDIEEAGQSYPKLSSVRCDVNKLGNDTAHIMLTWLETGARPHSETRYPVELIKRASS
jgi:LacI family transcriptional regulator, galactose operon repressor